MATTSIWSIKNNLKQSINYIINPEKTLNKDYGNRQSYSYLEEPIKDYNFKTPGFKNGTGHFTQVVWADSKEVGFGFAKTKDGAYMGVANYYPFGNLNTKEAFQKNVKPPQS